MIIVENATPEFQTNIDSMCTELALSPKNPLGKSGLGGNFKIYNILRNLSMKFDPACNAPFIICNKQIVIGHLCEAMSVKELRLAFESFCNENYYALTNECLNHIDTYYELNLLTNIDNYFQADNLSFIYLNLQDKYKAMFCAAVGKYIHQNFSMVNVGKLCKLFTIGTPEDMLLILRSIGMQRVIDNNLLMNPDIDGVLNKLVRTV